MSPTERGQRPVRIANCSGFFGDRLSAAHEMVHGGPIDVLTGDWLAELTMLILHKSRQRNPDGGYAATFVTQMEHVLGTCLERGIKVVSNAGGLNPSGCADRVREIASSLGVEVKVAHVEGDDLMPCIDGLRQQHGLDHLDTGRPFDGEAISANAYLGGWGIARALAEGADVVITGRVTDAAVVLGPAAWWWDWQIDDLDALAGAVVAGHVIECGAQATGGNYSFFTEIPDRSQPLGFPIAEVDHDGSSIITKHPGTGGLVSVGTVTAQLLYEIGDERYVNPDVVARFDTIHLDQAGDDRVRISGVRGEAPPEQLKVSINTTGGYRNRMSFVLTGLEQGARARWAEDALFARLGGREQFDEVDVRFVPAPSDAPSQEAASGMLHVSVKSADERLVGRSFSAAAIELALANYPGFFATSTPGGAQAYGVFWPALVPAGQVDHAVVLPDGRRLTIHHPHVVAHAVVATHPALADPVGPQLGEALGVHFGARSGDKGGNANLGVWARDAAGYAWLVEHLTSEAIVGLLPEASGLETRRTLLPNLHAVNFVLVGYLGQGVAASTAFDPQAKGLGEYLRSRVWS